MHVHLHHELDVAAGNVESAGEEVGEEGAVVSKRRDVGGHERLLVRKGDIRRAQQRVGVVGVDGAAKVAPAEAQRDRPRLLDDRLEPRASHVVVAGRDALARLGAAIGVLKALQAERDRCQDRLGVLLAPPLRLGLDVKHQVLRLVRVVVGVAHLRAPLPVPLGYH